ncbi:hypothetical protein [Paenibacillus elgii]|uniref:hypothetical protein n=1 Tax=Paenibacillus elgii TaxID=189691 RepID=UPI00203F8A35|nr:hypothetical protein [Paenibacillus elgii]MCM3269092.1 hypothetical protein [Paenibacillus elgii]
MNHVVGLIGGFLLIIGGLFYIIFPKLGWKYDWGTNRKGKKYSKTEKINSIASGIVLIILGILIAIAGFTM